MRVHFVCNSNTRHRQLQTRRKSYDTKRTLQPLTQARIQASDKGIAPTNLPPCSRISQDPKRSSQQSTPLYTGEEHSATQPLLRIVLHPTYATLTYIRQDHVILNIAQLQHHPSFISNSLRLYISFIQANTQFVLASTMYAVQSNSNSCMPSPPFSLLRLTPTML